MLAVLVVSEFATMRNQGVHVLMESHTRSFGPSLRGAMHVTPPLGLPAFDDAASVSGEGVVFLNMQHRYRLNRRRRDVIGRSRR